MNVLIVDVPVPDEFKAIETLDLRGQIEHLLHVLASAAVAAEDKTVGTIAEYRQTSSKRVVRDHA
jgi:hypothetical protein